MTGDWKIEVPTTETVPAWLTMRRALWPETTDAENLREAHVLMMDTSRALIRLAWSTDGRCAGFAEATVRRDYVNGCDTSPVAFLEGIYVELWARRRGVARTLVAEVEAWARERGCKEFASDALLENDNSHRMHAGLGFEETERVVCFRKVLR